MTTDRFETIGYQQPVGRRHASPIAGFRNLEALTDVELEAWVEPPAEYWSRWRVGVGGAE
jgi:hypothetical protein